MKLFIMVVQNYRPAEASKMLTLLCKSINIRINQILSKANVKQVKQVSINVKQNKLKMCEMRVLVMLSFSGTHVTIDNG